LPNIALNELMQHLFRRLRDFKCVEGQRTRLKGNHSIKTQLNNETSRRDTAKNPVANCLEAYVVHNERKYDTK